MYFTFVVLYQDYIIVDQFLKAITIILFIIYVIDQKQIDFYVNCKRKFFFFFNMSFFNMIFLKDDCSKKILFKTQCFKTRCSKRFTLC